MARRLAAFLLLSLSSGCAPVYDLGANPSLKVAETVNIGADQVLFVSQCEYAITFEDKREATWQHGILSYTSRSIYVFRYQGRDSDLKRVVDIDYGSIDKVALDTWLDSLQVHIYMPNYMLVVVPTHKGTKLIDRASTKKVYQHVASKGVASIETAKPVLAPRSGYIPIVVTR